MLKQVKNLPVVTLTILLLISLLVIASSYFNSEQIRSLSAQCLENNGAIFLEIHNPITNDYSFECKENKVN